MTRNLSRSLASPLHIPANEISIDTFAPCIVSIQDPPRGASVEGLASKSGISRGYRGWPNPYRSIQIFCDGIQYCQRPWRARIPPPTAIVILYRASTVERGVRLARKCRRQPSLRNETASVRTGRMLGSPLRVRDRVGDRWRSLTSRDGSQTSRRDVQAFRAVSRWLGERGDVAATAFEDVHSRMERTAAAGT
ncbi:hypothetical protein DAEQUDRAFT_102464 [Daedalea quercina L-15889]|uniref:Uncharacterized protein n=1 Tax=Daedalea quercina L-15889 TaxID=1314783 RepID=A0A165KVH9_9APHY|nr:hypothetical protein DAEQUDRAFT_102464 [Daedalea quercina L-15889]